MHKGGDAFWGWGKAKGSSQSISKQRTHCPLKDAMGKLGSHRQQQADRGLGDLNIALVKDCVLALIFLASIV